MASTICSAGNLATCAVTVLDHYTRHHSTGRRAPLSSHFGFARCGTWSTTAFIMCKNAALTFVTVVALRRLFNHPRLLDAGAKFDFQSAMPRIKRSREPLWAADSGLFNSRSGPKCDDLGGKGAAELTALAPRRELSLAGSGFFSNQRMFNIYDGPAYQDTNAYPDITETDCPNRGYNGGCIYGSGNAIGVTKSADKDKPGSCYLPNAAIAWKQPMALYAAFHSDNLFFDIVDIRHYVIDPRSSSQTPMSRMKEPPLRSIVSTTMQCLMDLQALTGKQNSMATDARRA